MKDTDTGLPSPWPGLMPDDGGQEHEECNDCGHVRYPDDPFNRECGECCLWARVEIACARRTISATEPMIPLRLFEAAVGAIEAYINADRDGTEEDVEVAGDAMDAAIRAAREGAK